MERANGFERGQVVYKYNERTTSSGTSLSQAEIRDILANSGVNRRGKESVQRMEHFDDEYGSYSRGIHSRMGSALDADGPEYVDFQGESIRTPMESLRSRPPVDQWGARGGSGKGRFDHFPYHDEWPPAYNLNSYYVQSERARFPNHDLDRPPRIENLENSRAEILRKLDELEDQLGPSHDMTGKPRGRHGADQRMIPATSSDHYPRNNAAYVRETLISSHGVNRQPFAPHVTASPYLSQDPRFIPNSERHSPSFIDPYPQRRYRHEVLPYADTYQQEMSQRPPHQAHYTHWDHEHFNGYHGNVNHDLFVLPPDEKLINQPACSCVHCCNTNWNLPDPTHMYDRRSQNELRGSDYHHRMYPNRHGTQGYNSGRLDLHSSHSQQSLSLDSTEVDLENDVISRGHPRKAVEAHRTRKVWHPIACGAPLIACCNCFELLKLPRKHISLMKNQQKLKCGACSSLILFELGKEDSTITVSRRIDHVSTEIDDASSLTVDQNIRYQHGGSDSIDTNAISTDYVESEPNIFPVYENSISGEYEKQLDPLSSALSLSKDEENPENLESGKHGSPSAELHIAEGDSFFHPRLSSEECHDDCSANIVVSGFEKVSVSRRSDFDQNTPLQNHVEDSEVATETDVSLNELPNSSVSQDTLDRSKEHLQMVDKGTESLLAGPDKNSFGGITNSTQDAEIGDWQVFVNGHFIPDHLVRKAEELAGPIQSGEYWYDAHAGFWGVMGYPCLGIIMPNIEELNYPMLENCAAGNTSIFVNGRELHQKDLDLLSKRGLPNTRHRSYLVEISGEVIDEDTGEELHSLGKLAPTVEKAKHGFGMRVPSFLARLQS